MAKRKPKTRIGRKFMRPDGSAVPVHEGFFMRYCTEAQYHSRNSSEALAMYREGCDLCSGSYGFRTKCDSCPIDYACRNVVSYHESKREGEVEDFQKYRRIAYA